MAFNPQTQYLFSQYGHGTGIGGAPDDPRKQQQPHGYRPPRFARQPGQDQEPPSPIFYAQNNPMHGMGFAGDPTGQVLPEARRQPQLGMGQKQATLGAPAVLQHPLVNSNFFGDDER